MKKTEVATEKGDGAVEPFGLAHHRYDAKHQLDGLEWKDVELQCHPKNQRRELLSFLIY